MLYKFCNLTKNKTINSLGVSGCIFLWVSWKTAFLSVTLEMETVINIFSTNQTMKARSNKKHCFCSLSICIHMLAFFQKTHPAIRFTVNVACSGPYLCSLCEVVLKHVYSPSIPTETGDECQYWDSGPLPWHHGSPGFDLSLKHTAM